MKNILIAVISFYQMILSPLFKQLLGVRTQCRYSPSCSAYAKDVITTHGVMKGVHLALKRFLSCQPFSKSYGHI
jgi:putative membrane protein insertion efficiency factor